MTPTPDAVAALAVALLSKSFIVTNERLSTLHGQNVLLLTSAVEALVLDALPAGWALVDTQPRRRECPLCGGTQWECAGCGAGDDPERETRCLVCGVDITGRRPQARTCSDRCRVALSRRAGA